MPVRESYRFASLWSRARPGYASARENFGGRMAAMLRRPYVVGIAGGTGSGKTTVADKLARAMPPGRCVTIEHDAYYHDQGHLPPADREAVNYDHPSVLDSALLALHLRELREGRSDEVPIYDFATNTRRS